MEVSRMFLPNSSIPRALIKTIMEPSQDKPAAPIAMPWLRAFFLLVNRMITKKARSGGKGRNQIRLVM
jgi:hypothetical protein